MSAEDVCFIALLCGAIGFIVGVIIATPPRRRPRLPPAEPLWRYEHTKTVRGPVTKQFQTKRGKGR